ncbi:MAG: sigma-70 family RNA polymerase sigma factor [Planctomycetes bacterium]|nr:sigma-70 family RNA polymerase sigma factor [Planctomycetota bacterium]
MDDGKGTAPVEDEQRLKLGLASGNAGCYRDAYDLYGAAMFRTAMRMLGNQADAEDAVAETFAAVVQNQEIIGRVIDLKAYLFASVRHAACRILRNRRRRPTVALNEADLAGSPADKDDAVGQLWDMATMLPDEQRDVLILKIQARLTFEQIAGMLGISPNTAAGRYRYALQKLHQMARKENDAERK